MVTIKEDLTLLVKDMLEERLENHVKSNLSVRRDV